MKSTSIKFIILFVSGLFPFLMAFEDLTIQEVDQALKLKDFETARKLCLQALEGSDISRHLILARLLKACIVLNDKETAYQLIQKIAQQHNEDTKCLMIYAASSVDMGLLNQAEGIYKKILTINPLHQEALLNLSRLNLLAGKYRRALQLANDLINRGKNLIEARVIKAQCHLMLDEPLKAAQEYANILDQNPNHREALVGIFSIYVKEENWPEALFWNEEILRLYPQDMEVLYDRGLLYEYFGDKENARLIYTTLLDRDPHFIEASFRLYILDEQSSETRDMGIELERRFAWRRNNIKQFLTLGGLLPFNQKNHQEQIDLHQAFLEKHPNSVPVLLSLSDVYFEANQWNQSLSTLEKAKKIDPSDLEIQKDIKRLKRVKNPEIGFRQTRFSFDDYSPSLKRTGLEIERQLSTVEYSQAFSSQTQIEARFGWGYEKHVDALFDENDVNIDSRLGSLGLLHQFSPSNLMSARLRFTRDQQGGSSFFKLPEDKNFLGGHLAFTKLQGNWAHAVSFSRSRFFQAVSSPRRVQIGHFETTTMATEYRTSSAWKMLGHVALQSIEFQSDRQETSLGIQFQPVFWPSLLFETRHTYFTHPAESLSEMSVKQSLWLRDEIIFLSNTIGATYESRERVWQVRFSPLLSYQVFDKLTLEAKYDFFAEEGNDRDRLKRAEIFLAYHF